MASPPTDLIDVPDDLVDVPAAGAAAPPAQPWPGASQGVPRPIGVAAPAQQAPQPRTLAESIRGKLEAAVEVASQAVGAVVGGPLGFAGGVMARLTSPGFGAPGEAHRELERATSESMSRVAGSVSGPLRKALWGDAPMSEAGQENVDAVGRVLQQAPSVFAAPRGTVGMSPQQSTGIRQGLQVGSDMAGAAAGSAADAALNMTPRNLQRVATANDAGIPVYPHQLAEGAITKAAGRGASNIPGAGGAGVKRAQRENFSQGLARSIDPGSTATILDDVTYNRLMESAGERIGEIAGRTDVPLDTFGDLKTVARRDTPDVQGVVAGFADDLRQMAEEHGGAVPGTSLRKLRTEIQSKQRSTTNGDLKAALGRFVSRVDEALTEHAPEADMSALLEARRQYAVGSALEPLIAKHPDGMFPPAALQTLLTGTRQGRHRMARGRAGELGDYAELGSKILKEQQVSTIPERNLVYRVLGDMAAAGKLAAVYPFAAAYNLLGPRAVRWVAERQLRREGPAPMPPEPAGPAPLELAPAGEALPARPGAVAPESPLGDLTPDWETSPGAGGGAPRGDLVPGLVPGVDDAAAMGPARVNPTGPPARGAGSEIPAVPGRPDLPDTMVIGPPAEVAGTEAAGAAMQAPDAALARSSQETARLRERTASPEVQKVLDEHQRVLDRRAAESQVKAKRQADAAELRRVASETADPELQAALHARAAKLEGAEAVPTGRAKEVDAPKTKPVKQPDGPLPAGEATEVVPEAVEPAAAAGGPIEALDVPTSIRPPRTEPRSGLAGPKDKFVPGRVYRDSKGNRAVYLSGGRWRELD